MTAATTSSASGDFLGHPKGLYVCFATELWERFSFYGMKYLLLLYLTKYHLFTDSAGYDVLGAYAGLVYALPLIGGLLADRYLGMRKAVVFGALLLTAGHATMAYEGFQAMTYAAGTTLAEAITLNDGTVLAAGTVLADDIVIQDVVALKVFFFALALITVGVGFLKPNISTIVGKLYGEKDPRRDSGFTIFYMGINIGSFIATILCGWLGETYGWSYGFGAAGIGMLLGLITFLKYQHLLEGHAEPTEPARLKETFIGPINKEWAIYLGGLLSLALVWLLVQNEPVVHVAQNSLLIVAIVGIILFSMTHQEHKGTDWLAMGLALVTMAVGLVWAFTDIDTWLGLMLLGLVAFIGYGFKTHNSHEYGRTVVLMILITSTIVFWSLFEQSAGSMTLYADRVLDRNMGDTEIRASMFGSLNAGFIMLFAIPFAALWVWLAKRGWEPSTPVKFGLGIMQAGLGFGALVLGAQFADDAGKVAMIWLVLAYLLHTTGELCLSPVGLSAVTKLSIGKVVGVSMGTWFLATALSETVATRIGKMAAIDTSGAESADAMSLLTTYTSLYEFLMWVGLGVGLFMIVISPILKKGMHGIK
ncbi:peptide MFS transporter [Simiduia agarivorans]|uniref:Amino acid/peptide transporter n=1 Tax=Simiduia agarivorans (strain DSM 21679 / JCM 13881 / BCRC 17597 / SA1) TaxID=1117647 RepID=K4KR43_SIMAS|nr:peptide MFS transporter [Simiduia agarivorans]AFV00609.1 amino acid/peptide transporter [Simiduia agarivorans SA1 = DSM 21679]